jgi:2-polyprenyl-6-methoxyphenol hydroxylase-like FAD-dependent oxidoreductase
MRDAEVLIIGAGPTGLVLALWLTRLGVSVRIVDKTAEPGTTTRALVVHARTLEFYDQLGFAGAVVERGLKMTAANLWVAQKKAARVRFGDMGQGLSPFPFALIFSQDEHERLLIERLAALDVRVERQTALESFEETAEGVRAQLARADGSTDTCECAYIAGCDGAHSTVREALKIGFPGGTYTRLFYVADVDATGPAVNGELHAALDTADFLAVFPLKPEGRARLIGSVIRAAEKPHDDLSWDDVSRQIVEWMRIDVTHVRWFSTYRVHHRVADRFRAGRVFLLGDAAHIHSPVGGQGMNTGIGDAVNLAWKLAASLRHCADPSILDTFEPERLAFAQRLVATTDRAFTIVTSDGPIATRVRLRLVPLLLARLFELTSVRRLMFRTISQTSIDYKGSFLSEGRAGEVQGGDRLPWVTTGGANGAASNFAPLKSLDWQVHVYGDAASDLRATCDARRLPLHVFPWRPETGRTGLQRDAGYLVRPDGYVAVADRDKPGEAIASYLDRRNIRV